MHHITAGGGDTNLLKELGLTKYAVDEFSFSTETQWSTGTTYTLSHSLGEVPLMCFLYYTGGTSKSTSDDVWPINSIFAQSEQYANLYEYMFAGFMSTGCIGYGSIEGEYSTSITIGLSSAFSSNSIVIKQDSGDTLAFVDNTWGGYKLITMA